MAHRIDRCIDGNNNLVMSFRMRRIVTAIVIAIGIGAAILDVISGSPYNHWDHVAGLASQRSGG